MEAATAIGLTVSALQLITILSKSSIEITALCHDLKTVDASIEGLAQELEAFRFHLSVVKNEFQDRTGSFTDPALSAWSLPNLQELLANAASAMRRLEEILKDLSRERDALGAVRKHYRSSQYASEVGQLRRRIQILLDCMHTPLLLSQMYVVHPQSSWNRHELIVSGANLMGPITRQP